MLLPSHKGARKLEGLAAFGVRGSSLYLLNAYLALHTADVVRPEWAHDRHKDLRSTKKPIGPNFLSSVRGSGATV
jgi:hypothetical protein